MHGIAPLHPAPLGALCVSLGLMREEDVHRVLDRLARGENARFGELALELGVLDERGLALALAEQYHLNVIPDHRLAELEPERAVLDLLPAALLRRHQLVPFRLHERHGVLSVVIADPTNLPALRDVQAQLPELRLRVFVGTRMGVRQFVDRLLGPPDEEEIFTEEPGKPFSALRGFGGRGTLVVEPDPVRLVLVRKLEELDGGRAEFAQDPEQAAALLLSGAVGRVVHRAAVDDLVGPYRKAWQHLRPDLQVYALSGYGPGVLAGPEPSRLADFLIGLLTFAFLSGARDTRARIRLGRTVELARATAGQLGLPPTQVQAVALSALLVGLEDLGYLSALAREREERPGELGRFPFVRDVLAAWPDPYGLGALLDALERRLRGGGPIGRHLGAEVVYTCRAFSRRGQPGETEPEQVLGKDLYHHLPLVVRALGQVLRWQADPLDTALSGGDPEVLLASRDPDLLPALGLELRAAGFRPVEAENLGVLVRLARARQPCCAVVDARIGRGRPEVISALWLQAGLELPALLLADGDAEGFAAVLPPDAGPRRVVERVRALIRGRGEEE